MAAAFVAGLVILTEFSNVAGAANTSKSPILVGVVAPESGSFSTIGTDEVHGLQAEAALLNKQGGILGRKIKILTANDDSDPQQAVSAATALLSQNHLDLFVPDVIFVTTQIPIAEKDGVLTIDNTNVNISASQFPLAYIAGPGTPLQLLGYLQYVKQVEHATKVGVIATNDTAGAQFVQGVSTDASKYNLQVVSSQSVADTATDVTSQLQQLRSAGAQAVLAYTPGTSLVGGLMSGMKDLGWNADVVGLGIFTTVDVDSVVPSSTLGQIKNFELPTDVRTTSGQVLGYNGIDSFVNKVATNGYQATQTVISAGAADNLRLAQWAWTRAGKVNAQAGSAELNGMAKLKAASALPSMYSYPSGTNLGYSKTVHDTANVKLPYSFWALITYPNTEKNGTLIGHHL
jgi:branched-chain amino acid transport system substrate-binding protein